ncbi:hypothetical protein X769_05370 [Mesorhizobium sp. LSJC268A00]|nr:hypothetical protein X769_05370 [Mesorhizobium sp. LSJC268A00]ESX39998.1 hypothetical protein X763_01610 [Mesorhizobium sp. LSHC432A00]ESX94456.1 hypothetical protein X754_12455 [Mesorhizobium sp. LNJC403B00]ESY47223.1 hypothetical protein X746_13550 [Mesorhizobium sp. LNJC380A00]
MSVALPVFAVRPRHDFDAAILLVAERLVEIRPCFQIGPVGNHKEGSIAPLWTMAKRGSRQRCVCVWPIRKAGLLFIAAPDGM